MLKKTAPANLDICDVRALELLRSCPKSCQSGPVDKNDLQAICLLRNTLMNCSRKPFRISTYNYPKATCDERCLLEALAATQSGNENKKKSTIEWLVHGWANQRVTELLEKVAEIFSQHEIKLNVKPAHAPIRRETPGLYKVVG